MSFCSPTIGSGRPRTFGSKSAACSIFPAMLHRTEQIPKTQLPDIHPDIHPTIATRPGEEVGVVRIACDANRVQRGDGSKYERALVSRHAVHARNELDVAHRSAPADREVEHRRSNSAREKSAL